MRPTTYRVNYDMFPGRGGCFVVLVVVLASAALCLFLVRVIGGSALLIPIFALASCFAIAARPAKLTVGADGLSARWMFRHRFVPYSAMRDVSVHQENLRTAPPRLFVNIAVDEPFPIVLARADANRRVADDIADRIRKGIRRAHKANAPLLGLDRGGRTIDAWIADLQSAGTSKEEDYRTAGMAPETLMAVLDDPGQRPEARVAAAVVMATENDAGTLKHIRKVASRCASEELKKALEVAADSERRDELASAIASVSAEQD